MDHYSDQEWRRPGQIVAGVLLWWGSLALFAAWALLGLREAVPFSFNPGDLWFNLIILVPIVVVTAWATYRLWTGSPLGRILGWLVAAFVTVWPGALVAEAFAGGRFDGRTYLLVVAIGAILLASRLTATPEVTAFIDETHYAEPE